MEVKFNAHIKDCGTKSLVTGDDTTRIVLEIDGLATDILAYLAALQKCERNKSHELTVSIADG